jgi:hypothetical protein
VKTLLSAGLSFCLGLLYQLPARAAATPTSRLSAPVKEEWRAINRTSNQTRWQSVTWRTNTATLRAHAVTNSYVELGGGLNITNAAGNFVSANPAFQITAFGAEATGTIHHVSVPADIGAGVGIRITKPGGEALVFQPLALNYFDPTDGQNVVLDIVTNAVGWLTASNEIIFSNCFTGIKASIRIRNSRSGLEHDVILHERPPDPTTLGLTSAARLEMLTEQLAGATPAAQEMIISRETDPARRAAMLQPDFTDSILKFGGTNGMKMGRGKAFGTGNLTNSTIASIKHPVGKSYLTIENRRILIEAVEHRRALPALNLLPSATNTPSFTNAALNTAIDPKVARLARYLPHLPKPEDRSASARIRIAQSPQPVKAQLVASASPAETPSFVLDYHILNNTVENDLILRGDTTYIVSDSVYLTGDIRIEGGTVVKFTDYGMFFVDAEASLVCDTTNYLPAVFTCSNDDSLGEQYGPSDGSAAQTGGAFYFFSGSWEFRNVRFTHLAFPIVSEGGSITFRNSQMIDAFAGFECGTVQINVFNGLFKDCAIIYEGGEPSFRGEHVTVHNATMLGYSYSSTTIAALTNSLLVAVTDPPDYVGIYREDAATVVNLTSDSGVFQTVEGGEHYLPSASSQRTVVGSVYIDGALKKELSEMTTHAPTPLTGTATTDQTLSLSKPRDVATIGYHYSAVDYITKDLTLENSTLTLRDGVIVAGAYAATANYASVSLNPGKFISIGAPTRMNRLLRANQVQENIQIRGETILNDGTQDEFRPELILRFTDVSSLAGEIYLISATTDFNRFELSHSTLFNGGVWGKLYGGGYNQLTGFTNNLFRYVLVQIECTSPAKFHAYNNTVKDAPFYIGGGNENWGLYDNLFDHVELHRDTSFPSDFNAYVGMTEEEQLPNDTTSIPISSISYANGPLGKYYVTGTALVNGSRLASAASLYHFTTETNQTKEGGSQVNVGFHYVALDSENQPFDFEPDGLADYLEDTTGNGLFGTGDLSDYRNKDSDGDGLDDGFEYSATHTSLTVADTGATATSDGYKDSDKIEGAGVPDGVFNQEEMQRGTDPLVPDVAEPLFSPVGGGSYASAQTVTVNCQTADVIIRYTLNGDEPTASTTTTVSSGSTVSVPVNSWLKAKAFKTGWTTSDTRSERYQTAANTAPTVSVLPATGSAFVGSDSIEILVQASDSSGIAKVQLFRGNYKVAETTDSVLRFTLHNVPSGTYAFTARAIDNQGAVTVSPSVSIDIASSGSVVSLFGAQPFFTSSPGALVAKVTGVNPGNLSSMTINGDAVPLVSGEFMLFPELSEGENTFTLLVNGTVSASTKVYLDTTVPVIAITAPANSSSLSTERINVTGTFTESNLKRITVNGVLAFTSSGNFEARNVPLVEGSQKIVATAEDIAGNIVSVTNTVTGSSTPSDPVQLTVTPIAGFAPLSISITVVNNAGTLQNVYYDWNGNGVMDSEDDTDDDLTTITGHTYEDAGQYFPIVTIKTAAGRFSSLGGWNASPAVRVSVEETASQLDLISVDDPIDIKVGGPANHLYVLSGSTATLSEFDADGEPVRSMASLPNSPSGIAVDAEGNVFIVLSAGDTVAKVSPAIGTFEWDNSFNGISDFTGPIGIALRQDGLEIAVSDSGNHRIRRYTIDGTFISSFGEYGSGLGQFDTPKGIAYDQSGNLYIVDSGNDRIVFADSSGKIVGTSGSSGSAFGHFQGPVGLAVGRRGIYVADAGNDRVQTFNPVHGGHGAELTPFDFRIALASQFGGLSEPKAIASIPDFLAEKIYIADTGNDRVIKVSLPESNTPGAVWTAMKASILGGNIAEALTFFASESVANYRSSFVSAGVTVLSTILDKNVTAVAIDRDTAQYYFEDTIGDTTFTFPVEFVREDGVWKILEF